MNFENIKIDVPRNILITANILAFLIALSINILSNALPLNNKTAGQISDSLYNYFAPAGYVFAIWFVIYIGWLLFIYYISFSKEGEIFLEKANIWLIVNLLLNGSWLIFWHYGEYLISVLTMLGIFFTLLILYERLEIGKKEFSRKNLIFIQIPISIYFGWITVATIANITSYLVSLNITFGDLDVYLTVSVIFVGTLITLLVLFLKHDFYFSLVPIWAFFGIYVKQSGNLPIYSMTVALTGLICAVIILLLIIYKVVKPTT